MRISDWSSDVCSSDLNIGKVPGERPFGFLWKSIALLWNHVSILSSLGSRRPCGNFPGEPDMPMVIDWSQSGESQAPPPPPITRAAQYVRMSTEHQKYSTDNQSAVIRRYAEERGYHIVNRKSTRLNSSH